MSKMLTLNDLLTILNIENLDDDKGREVMIPEEVVEQIKRESPKRQSTIITGLLRLRYGELHQAQLTEEGHYEIRVGTAQDDCE